MSKRSITAMVLAFLVPGAGHYYLGYRVRAAAFFIIIVLMLAIGLAIDGSLYTLANTNGAVLRLLAAFGSMGAGIPYFIPILASTQNAQFFGFGILAPHPDVTSITFEYGSTFTLTAGLMNLLLVLDCFDITEGRKK